MSDLGTLGGPSSIASGAHASGPVVGWADTAGQPPPRLRLRRGEMADLNALIATGTGWELDFALSVNALGQVVGGGAIGGESSRAD